jgi:hypothetical protein
MEDQKRTLRSVVAYLGFLLLWLGIWLVILGSQSTKAQQAFQTQQAVIFFKSPVDLLEMARRLRSTPSEAAHQSYFFTQDPSQPFIFPGLATRVDGILAQVCLILNLWPPKTIKLRIFLLKDGQEVRQRHLIFQPFMPRRPIFGYEPLEGFYEPRSHTIFVSLADLRVGILAHEMTHYVLCESFAVPPPGNLQEDWARYVESRLR